MGQSSENKPDKHKKQICIGILAHVDAGKTTLSEALLYLCGSIRKLGRVDHGDAFLDTFALERARGITIFSKQAKLQMGDMEVTLLDTPGHADFAAEMERTLQVLDYAVLVISGADGVQGHTETLWRLLAQYHVPVFLFINKMDQPGTDRMMRLRELQNRLDGSCIWFGKEQDQEQFYENLAMCDEDVMEHYLENGEVTEEEIVRLISGRKVFPCFFGSALKLTGVEELMQGLEKYTECPEYPPEFGARIYKISRDEQGKRLTHMKITGGSLKVKTLLTNRRSPQAGEERNVRSSSGAGAERNGRYSSGTGEEKNVRSGSGAGAEQNGRYSSGTGEEKNVRSGSGAGAEQSGGYSSGTGEEKNVWSGSGSGIWQRERNASKTENNPDGRRSSEMSGDLDTEQIWEEKADQIRIYSGAKYEVVTEAPAGTVCAVTGLTRTWAGQGLGIEREALPPLLEPVLTYRIELPEGCDVHGMLQKLRMLEEEEPQLHIVWNERLGEIHAQVMGEVQIEILQSMIRERCGVEVRFGTGKILYKETILEPVEGAGHFEPLRHYAEVHLLMEPGERGSGIQVESACSVDALEMNWQRLILTHLLEKEHVGVLTGAPVTDLRITLTAGRAHQKHTEGGDFRQATYRAVRQGLKKARNVLLEPFYAFRLEIPSEATGRALADIQRMSGTFDAPETAGDMTVLTGSAPVSEMRGYQMEVSAYTRGRGRLSCDLKGYEPCHNAEEIIASVGYDSERDLENPTGSVFCAHGAGFLVSWDMADSYMHVGSGISQELSQGIEDGFGEREADYVMGMPSGGVGFKDRFHDEDELKAIFERTYGSSERASRSSWKRTRGKLASGMDFSGSGASRHGSSESSSSRAGASKQEPPEEYLLVDGYNIIFAWPKLKELADRDIGAARTKLMDILCNYQGFTRCRLILVFDAYRVEGHPGEVMKYHNIHVVYTKEAETADQYIEKTVREISRKYHVTVATSDGLEQVIILGEGARRWSASDFAKEIAWVDERIREINEEKRMTGRNYLFDGLDEELAGYMEDVRLGRKKI